MVSYKDLHQGTNGFSDDNLIGSGGFGTILAVKVLNIQENIRLAHKSLLAECNALKNVRHRNLVRVLTYCSSLDHKGNDFKALVFEFMSNGSLEDWLHSRLNIMVDVASALHYLHDLCETPVVHCDLKPSNGNESSTIGIRGTFGYAPPEYGMGMSVSVEGDVYSYGILVLEIFTGKRPTDEMFKDGMNLREFVKASIPDGITTVLDPSMSLSFITTTGDHRSLVGNRDLTHDDDDDGNNHTVKECLVSVLEIGLGCSTYSAGERMKTADVARTMASLRDDFVSVGRRTRHF
ncbi:Probable LRR receptor-like serine/threonine-protein kinase At3g47570 [Linum grandiflorum]